MRVWAYVIAAYGGSALLYLVYLLHLLKQEAALKERLEGGDRG